MEAGENWQAWLDPGFLSGAVHVELRGDDGLVAEKVLELVETDISLGKVGGEGVAQTLRQRAALAARSRCQRAGTGAARGIAPYCG